MQRVSIVGASGVGKTSFGAALAEAIGAPFHELDALHWSADWTPTDRDVFRREVERITSGERWVIDGNYSAVRDLVLDRADTVVWLRLPRRVTMVRLMKRSLDRAIRRRVLWDGNTERLSDLARWWDSEHLLRWSWSSHARHRARYGAEMSDPDRSQLRYVVLTRSADVAHFLAAARREGGI